MSLILLEQKSEIPKKENQKFYLIEIFGLFIFLSIIIDEFNHTSVIISIFKFQDTPLENNGCNKENYQSIDGGNHCYKLVSKNPQTWENARQVCSTEGSSLVSILNRFEQAYVSLVKTGSVNAEWIGLKSVKLLNK